MSELCDNIETCGDRIYFIISIIKREKDTASIFVWNEIESSELSWIGITRLWKYKIRITKENKIEILSAEKKTFATNEMIKDILRVFIKK